MGNHAIQVENVSKEYKIGTKRENTLITTLVNAFRDPLVRSYNLITRKSQSAANLTQNFRALQNITFDVEPGEVLGIIGHNGAGKSTLLKLLSRVAYPTTGTIKLYGRVGAFA